jgi:adhesin/invasin
VRPAVLVADAGGNPVAGVEVEFEVASGGGTATGTTVTTGADGIATVGSWVLGTQAGPNTLTATAAGAGLTGNPATFTVNAAAGPATALAVSAGDNQAGVVGQPVAVPPAVLATDAYGNAVENLEVDFAVASGGGAITGAIQYTGATGTAAVGSWTLGPTPGANTLTATGIGAGIAGSPITFTATAAAALNAAQYAGNWSGTWTNTTFASTGTTTLVIAVDENASTVTLTSSSTGNVLGQGGGAPQQSRMVAYDATGLTLTATLQLYGDVVMTVDGSGNVVAAGTNVPAGGIDRWDATGTITPTTMQFNFTIAFTGGGTAAGTVTLNKQ